MYYDKYGQYTASYRVQLPGNEKPTQLRRSFTTKKYGHEGAYAAAEQALQLMQRDPAVP
jgi:hypothetical protein